MRAWLKALVAVPLLAGCVKRPLAQDELRSGRPRLAQSKQPAEAVVEARPTPAPSAPAPARKPKDESGMGEELFKKGDFKRAVSYLVEAVKKDNGNYKLWRNLGAAYAMAEDYENSLRCFQAALRRNPADIKTHYNLSLIYSLKGSADEAEAAAKKGLELEPQNPGLHSSLGNVYADKEKDDAAMEEYKTALRIRPDDPITRFNKGGLHFKRRELGEAEKEYREVLRLKPEDAEAAQNLAAVYILQDRLAEAEKLNRFVIKSKPKDEDTLENAYFNLGLIYDRQNKLERGLDMYKLALQVAPWDAAAYVNAAVILERLNRKKEALAYWQKYERLFPASRRAGEVHKRIEILKKMVALEADKAKKASKGADKTGTGGE
jgi:tetratricopeptide (TPR) repeat protein